MYCVNTIIADKETTATTIFYDEAMTDILEMSCEDMIMSKGYNDTTIIPDEILAVEGQRCQVQMTLRRDTILNVNSAKKLSLLTPATPITKAATPKRTLDDSPGSEQVKKKFKK